MPSGSPPETRNTTLNMLNVQTAPSTTAGSSVGRSSGSVTRRKRLPARRAVDLGRLEDVLRDRRERAHGDHHHEREAEPHVGRDVGRERGGELREPRDGLGAERDEDIARHHVPEFARVPWAKVADGFILSSLQDDVTRDVRPALLAVFAAVLLVLTIACVNVTNLLLARGIARRAEFAMRVALGAARTRLIRLMLTESLLLAVIGGVLGMVVANGGIRALVALSPPELPRAHAIGIDAAVFAFGIGITTLIGVLIGLIPALHLSRRDLHAELQQAARPSVGGQHHLTRRMLVVAEVALAIVLLVGAGLLSRSMQRLLSVAPGFDASGLLTLQVQDVRSEISRPADCASILSRCARVGAPSARCGGSGIHQPATAERRLRQIRRAAGIERFRRQD